MELPNLGQHCSEKDCRQLDFLPIKCDLCTKVFCGEHYSYVRHNCPHAFTKNVQVPVCPLCNQPVPGKADELPDIRVSRHIDADCKSDKAVNRRKVYTNKCSHKGCKQKELIPVLCDSCLLNFCLRHRHPQDHECTNISKPARPQSKAAVAASLRNSKSSESQGQKLLSSMANGLSSVVNGGRSRSSQPNNYARAQSSLQGNMSEDTALQLALQASLAEQSTSGSASKKSTPTAAFNTAQEHEDFLLAQAIAESERESQQATNNSQGNQRRGNNCQIT